MRKVKLLPLILFVVLGSAGFFLLKPHKALAASFSVNSTADDSDASAGDGNCDNGSGDCTLRAAIQEVNALSGTDTINFDIPGSGVKTISPGSPLPTISSRVNIDGSTQSGASCGTLVPADLPASSNTPHNLLVQLDLSLLGAGYGLRFDSGGANSSIVRGFVINGDTTGPTIYVSGGASSITIECNYFGTNATGTTAVPNTNYAISIDSGSGITVQNNLISSSAAGIYGAGIGDLTVQNNLIGTSSDGNTSLGNTDGGVLLYSVSGTVVSHNVIAGNNSRGIYVSSSNTFSIKGNLIGVNLSGAALGNGDEGLLVYGSNNFGIGGTAVNERNVISANTGDGIHIYSDCGSGEVENSTIFGNYIGTKTDGKTAANYGNGKAGIEVNEFQGSCGSVYRHQIGGDNNGEQNIIAGNNKQGVLIHQDTNHDVFSIAILHNSIFSNGQQGIDLAADSSDDGAVDTDLGPNAINELSVTYPSPNSNNYLNHPTINSASYTDGKLTVNYNFKANGILDSGDGYGLLAKDLVGYRLDFYINDNATDGAFQGYGQAQTYLGSFIVNGSATDASHEFSSSSSTLGKYITATATLLWTKTPSDGNTERPCGGFERTGNGPPYQLLDCPT